MFLEWENIGDMLTETSVLFMMALAQMVVILTRGIDLSVAANLALSGMMAALVSQYYPETPLLFMILTGVLAGLVLGMINGALIAFLGIPPIVVTLGTLAIFRGMIIIIAGGDQVNASEMGAAFQAFPKARLPRADQPCMDRHRRLHPVLDLPELRPAPAAVSTRSAAIR